MSQRKLCVVEKVERGREICVSWGWCLNLSLSLSLSISSLPPRHLSPAFFFFNDKDVRIHCRLWSITYRHCFLYHCVFWCLAHSVANFSYSMGSSSLFPMNSSTMTVCASVKSPVQFTFHIPLSKWCILCFALTEPVKLQVSSVKEAGLANSSFLPSLSVMNFQRSKL